MYNVGEHTLRVVQEVPAGKVLRWAALLHDVAKPVTKTTDEKGDHFYGHNEAGAKMAKDILARLKFDNATITRVERLVLWHDYGMGQIPSLRSFRKSLSKIPSRLFINSRQITIRARHCLRTVVTTHFSLCCLFHS